MDKKVEPEQWHKKKLTPKAAWIIFVISCIVLPPTWPIFLVIAIVVQVKAKQNAR